MPLYKAAFPAGTSVRIVADSALRDFRETWSYHHNLRDEQMPFAGRVLEVAAVGFYHGGDPLYELKGAPGLWHEACLEAA